MNSTVCYNVFYFIPTEVKVQCHSCTEYTCRMNSYRWKRQRGLEPILVGVNSTLPLFVSVGVQSYQLVTVYSATVETVECATVVIPAVC